MKELDKEIQYIKYNIIWVDMCDGGVQLFVSLKRIGSDSPMKIYSAKTFLTVRYTVATE